MTRLLGALAVACVLSASISSAAFAHGEDGTFSGLEATPGASPLEVSVRARLIYVNDSEPAPGATVVVHAIAPDGSALPPSAPLTDNGDGTYAGTVTLTTAGAWTIHFAATTPDAAGQTAYTAADLTTPTEPPPTTGISERGDASAGAGDGDDGGSGSAPVVVAVALALVLLGGVAAVLLVRRRRA